MENNNDVFMLGGHEFHSRFILGSGNNNSHLIRAAVEYADARSSRSPCAVPIPDQKRIFWTLSRRT